MMMEAPARSGRLEIQAGPWKMDTVRTQARFEMFSQWMGDPVVARSLGRRSVRMPLEQVSNIMAQHDGRTGWLLFVSDREKGGEVGYVSLTISPMTGIARVDMILGDRGVHARPFISHVALAVADWLFETVGARKIILHVLATNRPTNNWARGFMALEGVLREEVVLPDGGAVDQNRYAILRREWPVTKARGIEERDRGDRKWIPRGGRMPREGPGGQHGR